MSPLSNLAVRDVETLIHPYTKLAAFRETGPLVLERGKGVFVYDTEGKGYIEGMAGLWCTALGYGNEELVEAAAQQMRKLPFAHLFSGKSHDPAIELAEKLKEIAPVPTSKVFFCNSGSEANDTQIKLVWYMNNALGPAAQEEDHQPGQGLSRRDHRRRLAHRACRSTIAISICRSPASCMPAVRIIIASRRRARARRISPRRLAAELDGHDRARRARHRRRPSSPSR